LALNQKGNDFIYKKHLERKKIIMEEKKIKICVNNGLNRSTMGESCNGRYIQLSPNEVESAKEKLCLDRFFRLLASVLIDLQLKNVLEVQSKGDVTYGTNQ